MMTTQNDVNAETFVLEGELTIYNATEVKDRLLAFIANHRYAAIDLSNVHEIDAAGLQLLLMIRQESQSKDVTLSFFNPSEAVNDIIELANLVDYLQLSHAAGQVNMGSNET